MMRLEDEEQITLDECEICRKFFDPEDKVAVTIEDSPLIVCPDCAATCHVGHWRAR